MQHGSYLKFALMMGCSFIFMYAAMFFNVERADHIMLSDTRTYMTFLMVSPMAIIMLALMWGMYKNKIANYCIIGGSLAVFITAFVLLRTQTPVRDIQYMKAMIPHHSSAIMTSKNAQISDPEVKALSEQIIRSQEEEIAQMKMLLERLGDKK